MLNEKYVVCLKYNDTVDVNNISCFHKKDFCRFRTRCIVYAQSTNNGSDVRITEEERT